MRIPSIRLYGKRKAQILTHKGIKSCSDRHIEIFCVCGRQLEITEINDEYLCVKGVIESISYKT